MPEVKPRFSDSSPVVTGFEILNACFDARLRARSALVRPGRGRGSARRRQPGFRHLQEKYGELRVSDTGIREVTIVGQAIGMALRGLRPIAEIQYLDYLLYALQIMSDDLASLRWRTAGGQKAPLIIRTRGHRLEGIWHAGSPMAGVINLLRGIYVCVPRDSPGRRLLQHHAALGRPGDHRRGPQRLSPAREAAGQHRRDDHPAGRAGGDPRRRRRHRRHLRRLLCRSRWRPRSGSPPPASRSR